MKKELESPDSKLMAVTVAAILLCVAFASAIEVFAQRRLGRPPTGRENETMPALSNGTSRIPDGYVLVIEMDDKLDSGTSRVSDRFQARLAQPVEDESGRALLQAGTVIEGQVTSVKRAKWRHRSGELGLSFNNIVFGNGRRIALRGTLVDTSNRIDEEGNLKAKSALRRDAIITTGAAAAGVGAGAITGVSMVAGGGIGAAAGLTVVMFMKGKDVVIDRGHRFNLQLTQPLYLTRPGFRSPTRAREPIPLQPGGRTGVGAPRSTGLIPGLTPNNLNTPRTNSGLVSVYDVRAERDRDGYLRVLITAQTPSNGWRIYTYHEIQPRDTLDIRLRGAAPSGQDARGVSHPSAPTVIVQDHNSEIRRIVVRGSNGDKYLTIGRGAASARLDNYQPNSRSSQPNSQVNRPRLGSGPSDGSSDTIIPPLTGGSSRSTLSSLATQVANQIELFRANYASDIGLWMNRDGSVDVLGERKPSVTERQLFDTLGYMLSSARTLASPSPDAYTRQQSRQRLQNDNQTAQGMWQRVQSSGIIRQERERQWQNLQNNVQALIDSAGR